MKIEEISNKGLAIELKVVVSAADIAKRVDAQIQEIKASIKMPGFRPGKVPTSLLKKQYGQSVMGKVLEECVNETSTEVFEKKKIKPALQPNIEVISFVEGEDLTYSIKVEVLPTIKVPALEKIKLERLVTKVDPKDVDKALVELSGQQKRFKKAAKTVKAKLGDAVLIDFAGTKDGVPFEGGTGQDFELELGSSMFIPGFEEQLVGVKQDDERKVDVKFPEGYHAPELAGMAVEFKVLVKEVRQPEKVKIDNQLAVDLGVEDLPALKKALEERISKESEGVTKSILKRNLLDELAKVASFDVPEGMVKLEFDQIWERIKMDAISEGQAKPEDFEGMEGPADKDEYKEYHDIAERRVRLGLLLSEIGQAEDVQIGQDELNRRIMEEAQKYPGQEKEVFEYFKKDQNAMAQLRAPIYEEKVCDLIISKAQVKDKSVTRKQLEEAINKLEKDEVSPKPKKAAKKSAAKKPAPKKAKPKKSAAKKAAPKKVAAKKAKK
jgi:trigger factor